MIKFVVGIDNGYDGAICLLNREDKSHACYSVYAKSPRLCRNILKLAAGKEAAGYDVHAIQRVAEAVREKTGGSCLGVIEAPISTNNQGGHTSAVTTEAMAIGRAVWTTLFALVGIEVLSVAPASWKAKMKLSRKEKSDHVSLAREMGCVVPRVKSPKGKLRDNDNIADAFLMARYLDQQIEVIKDDL